MMNKDNDYKLHNIFINTYINTVNFFCIVKDCKFSQIIDLNFLNSMEEEDQMSLRKDIDGLFFYHLEEYHGLSAMFEYAHGDTNA